MSDIEKRIKELEERVEKLEQDKKLYDPSKKFNPYDLSEIEKMKNRHKKGR